MLPTEIVTACWVLELMPVFWLTALMPEAFLNASLAISLPLYGSPQLGLKLISEEAIVAPRTEEVTLLLSENEAALLLSLLWLSMVLVTSTLTSTSTRLLTLLSI